MPSAIHARMAATAEMIAAFGDDALVRAALRFERELAHAAADADVLPRADADAVAAACARCDVTGLAEAAAHAGTLAIPLVARLRALALAGGGERAAAAVHLGATSQDLADTALMLQVAAAGPLLDAELAALGRGLATLTRDHAATPALGRTLLQPALAVTFGSRSAHWLLGVDAARVRLRRELATGLRVQLGGAAGTLAALGAAGPRVRAALARRLGLAPSLPWHGRRDGVAGIGAALGIALGALGKLARDVALLMQAEVAEVAEPRVAGRGGSSAMPHKHNPTGCQVALSAAIRGPGLVASLLAGMPQELERGLGGWQAEAAVLAELFELAHGAARALVAVIEGLEVDAAAMAARLDAALPDDGSRAPALAAAAAVAGEALALHEATTAGLREGDHAVRDA
jgi:3-carboxy-cis,cis-muconate cycloisomerase